MLVGSKILGAHNRTAGHVKLVEDAHQFALRVVRGKVVNNPPYLLLVLAPVTDLGEARIASQSLAADPLRQRAPDGFLHDNIDVIVGSTRFALDRVAELPATGIVAPARRGLKALRRYRVFRQRTTRQALVVAELDPAQIHHRVHHRYFDVLPFPSPVALVQCRKDTDYQMQAGARIADLRPGYERRAVGNTGGAHRAPH